MEGRSRPWLTASRRSSSRVLQTAEKERYAPILGKPSRRGKKDEATMFEVGSRKRLRRRRHFLLLTPSVEFPTHHLQMWWLFFFCAS